MEIVRPMPPVLGPAAGAAQAVPPEDSPASTPRPDVPPVTRVEAPRPLAPRPPDQARLGLVQAGLLASPAPIREYSPERALKPWGVAILPDSERAAERRAAQAERAAQAAREGPDKPPPGTASDSALADAPMSQAGSPVAVIDPPPPPPPAREAGAGGAPTSAAELSPLLEGAASAARRI